MISQAIQNETDLWEVWIEYDPCSTQHFGTLYVIGEITVEEGSHMPLIRKTMDTTRSELVLEVPSRPVGRSRMKEVLFSEPIPNPDCYASVSIYAGSELIARFSEIEIIV